MPKKRGLARLSKQRRREIAKQGNQKLRELGKIHEFSSEEAREAGKKGGRSHAHPEEEIFKNLTKRLRGDEGLNDTDNENFEVGVLEMENEGGLVK